MSDSPEPQLTERERAVLRIAVQRGPRTWREVCTHLGFASPLYIQSPVWHLRGLGLLLDQPPHSTNRSIVATEAGRRALHTRAGFPPRSEWPLGALCVDGYYDGLGHEVYELR